MSDNEWNMPRMEAIDDKEVSCWCAPSRHENVNDRTTRRDNNEDNNDKCKRNNNDIGRDSRL